MERGPIKNGVIYSRSNLLAAVSSSDFFMLVNLVVKYMGSLNLIIALSGLTPFAGEFNRLFVAIFSYPQATSQLRVFY